MSETLNDLRDVIYATNKANGWTEEHETKGLQIKESDNYKQ